ncbi:unnamed protein product [Pleuronectes platessa]|uniref:Uncharacterized protein n=1 Tax=Pleuronectes platessa TaxID=8262 RepID=A0A9N7YL42_PLEPL|nr:unnamed protein product [Pleuronectes platessa]
MHVSKSGEERPGDEQPVSVAEAGLRENCPLLTCESSLKGRSNMCAPCPWMSSIKDVVDVNVPSSFIINLKLYSDWVSFNVLKVVG